MSKERIGIMKIGIMNVTKRVLFIISLIVGNLAIGVIVFYFYDKSSMFESIAVFTSLATAIYAIMNEPEAKKEEPLLRITPCLAPYSVIMGLDILITNIGTSIAKNTKGTCAVISTTPIPLENNGAFLIENLAPREKGTYVATVKDPNLLSSEKVVVTAEYYDLENKKQPPIRVEVLMKDLQKEQTTKMYRRQF